jgi:catalase
MLVLGPQNALLETTRIPLELPGGTTDPGLIVQGLESDPRDFIAAIAKHRHFERFVDPPRI